jgi:hypothetical protein
MSFASMHNDYLDPDRHNNNADDEGSPTTGVPMAWHLYRTQPGGKTLLGVYVTSDGPDAFGSDMNAWMVENGYYGEEAADDYEWEGDRDSVAIMAKREGMPEFYFEWKAIEPRGTFEIHVSGDGTKWGPSDFYDDVRKLIADAFASGLDWDTSWLGCKKEILSSQFIRVGNTVFVTVSVSDDFDTNGTGESSFIIEDGDTEEIFFAKLEKAADEAHAAADADRKDNEEYIGFKVGLIPPDADKCVPWEWTYLFNRGGHAVPPGDNYYRWGWQEVPEGTDALYFAHPEDMPEEVADKLEELINQFICGMIKADQMEYAGYRVTPWSD